MIRLNSTAVTNVGKIRQNNEDNFFINGKFKENVEQNNDCYEDNKLREFYAFSVCDGMGGESFGEIASKIAVKSINRFDARKLDENINEYFDFANAQICDEIEKNDGARIGTTVALLYIKGNSIYCYNIGDSRVYRIRNNEISQLTVDHTQAQSMVDMGLLKQEEMNSHSGKHKLTQHLGIFKDELIIQPYETGELIPENDDIYIICSDGLTDMLSDDEILIITKKYNNSKDMANALVDEALKKGGKDNTTVIAIQIKDIIEESNKNFWTKLFNK